MLVGCFFLYLGGGVCLPCLGKGVSLFVLEQVGRSSLREEPFILFWTRLFCYRLPAFGGRDAPHFCH